MRRLCARVVGVCVAVLVPVSAWAQSPPPRIAGEANPTTPTITPPVSSAGPTLPSAAVSVPPGPPAPPASGRPGAAPKAAGRPPADVLAAQQVVFAAYPELWTQSARLSIVAAGPKQIVTVHGAVDPLRVGFTAPTLKVSALIELSAAKELVSFFADGPMVRTPQSQAFLTKAGAHPEWTAADTAAELSAAGGAVSAPLTTTVDAARWQTLLGKNPQARAASLQLHGLANAAAGSSAAAPGWGVDVESMSGGKATTYHFQFDPFSGRLVAVTRP